MRFLRKKIPVAICLFLTTTYMVYGQYKTENVKPIFSLVGTSRSNILFENTLVETKEANIFVYKGFYKGGGVAIADVNNDGLLDIYFSGNQVADKLYLNKGNLQFEDITKKAGILDKGGWSTHVSIVDVNNDGFKDIYVCKSLYDAEVHLRENELYINNGNLTFTESAENYNLNDSNRTTEANFFDYDRDGDLDVFIINQPKNSSFLSPRKGKTKFDIHQNYRLLENKNNRFNEIKNNAGILNYGYGLSSSIADFNNDGFLDIYVTNDYKGPDFFYINNKDGTFSNQIYKNIKHTSYFSMGSDVGDINNDGWLDLIVVDMVAEDNYKSKSNMSAMNPSQFWKNVSNGGHYQYMFNTLQLNNGITKDGDLQFSEIGQLAGISSTDWSWSPLLADFDNDGYLDLFVTNGIRREIGNTDALKKLDTYIAAISKKYNVTNSLGFDTWKYIDLEILLSYFPSEKVKNYIYKNANGIEFKNYSEYWGLDEKTFSTGAAYGDLDNDGDLDLVVNNIDEVAYLYENKTNKKKKNNYLRIRFSSAKTQSFLGTKTTIYHANGLQISQLTNARGISSSSEEIIHFGLHNLSKIDSLKIDWVDGKVSVLKEIRTNQKLDINADEISKINSVLEKKNRLFEDISFEANVNYLHKENRFGDYEREVLLPHRMSTLGSGIAVADVNGDGLEDFYVGAPIGKSGGLLKQNLDGTFDETIVRLSPDIFREDMGAVFFDADNDGDADLYVVSGGNESKINSEEYQDRLYLNSGNGSFGLAKNVIPIIAASGSRVKVADYDKDGDLDLFIGGRQVPGKYPEPADSYILKNKLVETGKLQFEKKEEKLLKKLGMVTDAVWTDFDGDNDLDLLITGMWMPITILENKNGVFQNSTKKFKLQNTTGWWFSVSVGDLDKDGDPDYVLGNLGLNYKYKAKPNAPFTVHYDDFDKNGKKDIVLSYYNYGKQYPLRGRSCSSQQIPDIKNKFKNYNKFAAASLVDVYGDSSLKSALHYEVTTFESVSMENLGKGKYNIKALPFLAQVSNISSSVIYDVDNDGIKDIVIAGNLYGSEIETPRNDASLGLFLKGKGSFKYESIPMGVSGLNISGDVKEIKLINYKGGKALIVASNNGKTKLIRINE